MHRIRLLFIALVVALGLFTPALAAPHCFPSIPGIDNCIDGRFNAYWTTNGGLSVFGYPITDQHAEINKDDGQSHDTQWFERNRFEQHSEKAAPYDVLLGRLGAELLEKAGRDWHNEPNNGNPFANLNAGSTCNHFDVTNRAVCGPFWDFWRAYGLHDPKLDAYNQSLQLFGLPLTGVKLETNPNGDTVLTQWFERARFEWHPHNPVDYKVQLGLLGHERLPAGPAPAPTPAPTPVPAPAHAGIQITKEPGTVNLGAYANIAIHTSANRGCSIEVDYKSRRSVAAGLYPKTTDGNGNTDWTWKVGTRTTPGDWPVIVTCDIDKVQTVVSVR